MQLHPSLRQIKVGSSFLGIRSGSVHKISLAAHRARFASDHSRVCVSLSCPPHHHMLKIFVENIFKKLVPLYHSIPGVLPGYYVEYSTFLIMSNHLLAKCRSHCLDFIWKILSHQSNDWSKSCIPFCTVCFFVVQRLDSVQNTLCVLWRIISMMQHMSILLSDICFSSKSLLNAQRKVMFTITALTNLFWVLNIKNRERSHHRPVFECTFRSFLMIFLKKTEHSLLAPSGIWLQLQHFPLSFGSAQSVCLRHSLEHMRLRFRFFGHRVPTWQNFKRSYHWMVLGFGGFTFCVSSHRTPMNTAPYSITDLICFPSVNSTCSIFMRLVVFFRVSLFVYDSAYRFGTKFLRWSSSILVCCIRCAEGAIFWKIALVCGFFLCRRWGAPKRSNCQFASISCVLFLSSTSTPTCPLI